jgi:1-deoxy-D-xylulose-5-phosphate reductoisomerase
LAQLGNPDMRTPIAHALAWPERIVSGVASLDIIATARLDFSAPDYERFPCLKLAQQAAARASTAPTILNAANEIAVAAFLQRKIRFDQISQVITNVMDKQEIIEPDSLELVIASDLKARQIAHSVIAAF